MQRIWWTITTPLVFIPDGNGTSRPPPSAFVVMAHIIAIRMMRIKFGGRDYESRSAAGLLMSFGWIECDPNQMPALLSVRAVYHSSSPTPGPFQSSSGSSCGEYPANRSLVYIWGVLVRL